MEDRKLMARKRGTYHGKPFKKNSKGGKFKRGTWVRYKYVNGRRVATVRSKTGGRRT